jgi:NAD(P)-dependent dehydrogenase (short-subunit alcohol dehydrogenase family)
MAADADRPLSGRHAVVTGGAKGIGVAIARRLARDGARLSLLGRDRDALDRAAAELAAAVIVADVTDAEALSASLAAIGPVDILVNNAGGALSRSFLRHSLADWQSMLSLNLTSAFVASQAVLPGMIERDWGRIVSVASTAGLKGYGYVAAYCAAKHGLVGLTRALALETALSGVTVNAVCPGFTDTELVARAEAEIVRRTGRSGEAARAALVEGNPQRRLIRPEEVAEAVAFLCLPAAASMTGQSIVVAGGEVM